MKIRSGKKLVLITALAILSSSLVVYAATTLFTQTIPGQTFATPLLVEGAACSGGNLVLLTAQSTVPSWAGLTAILLYGCSSNGDVAFTTTGSMSTSVSVTPTFTVPNGWGLGVGKSGGSPPICQGTMLLTSGVAISLSGDSEWYYCLYSPTASSFSSFSITWSQ